ncbi:nuclear transport factor 2 family protein [Pengzhenrongella sicca]|uniref:Nuclear transport factor 2 family protein n=1 Tax=Pengzhenrongella sicca TaxID=2819238 RepID=A0A8A4Z7L2_9MICO|nr:nuclear transport factor 2 family protein [Pengzhenrongella sicca]QTE27794.1 nuclear transport factor 2 family protein [Pengzhenrongella sicca]
MNHETVMAWVAAYERSWRDQDDAGVGELFSDEASYLLSPYEPPLVGLAAIRDFWVDTEGDEFTLSAEVVAVDGAVAVVRALVRYGGDSPQEYTDLWVLRFASDGRVEHFEEWAYWPGKSYTAETADVGADADATSDTGPDSND